MTGQVTCSARRSLRPVRQKSGDRFAANCICEPAPESWILANDMSTSAPRVIPSPGVLGLILAASAILLVTMGVRQTSGLFLLPITQSTGVSIVAFSFALAIGQFVFGAAQPVFGAIADKFGAVRVIVAGALLLSVGSVLTPFMTPTPG